MDLAPYATFAVYAIISVVRDDQTLLASQAFTSLSLISLMTSPLLEFVQAVPSFIQCVGCFERIESYLEKEPITNTPTDEQMTAAYGPTNANPQTEYADKLSMIPADISFLDADIAWSSDSEAILRNLTLEIGKGITMIVGPVGSGKSALIKSILGEMTLREGFIHIPFRNIAYCSQIPWIVDDTIRHNITGGTEFNAAWYNFVISTCALNDDFQSLPAGDMHVAGSRGASLSGGQKQRVVCSALVDKGRTLMWLT